MNPNAKEFVPAHLLKRRQEDSVNQLAEQVGQVDILDNGESRDTNQASTMTNNNCSTTTTTTTTTTNNSTTKPSENGGETSKLGGDSTNYQHTNGTSGNKPDLEEDDRYLLKGGEAFCEFNGEQFIIPGEDEEYDDPSEPSDPEMYARSGGFDFGNPEDNEDEDVCNAYEQFLDNLPE